MIGTDEYPDERWWQREPSPRLKEVVLGLVLGVLVIVALRIAGWF